MTEQKLSPYLRRTVSRLKKTALVFVAGLVLTMWVLPHLAVPAPVAYMPIFIYVVLFATVVLARELRLVRAEQSS